MSFRKLDLSAAELRRRFADLPAPQPSRLPGRWRIELPFAGPLRLVLRATLALAGLGGWIGKQFDGADRGVNLVRRGHLVGSTLPMALSLEPSGFDRKPALVARYPRPTRWPWHRVTEEMRALDDDTLVDLIDVALPLIRRQRIPLLLYRD